MIKVNTLKDIIITNIMPPMTVHSETGLKFQKSNRQYYGLALCISGQITYKMNGKTFVSSKGSAVILPKGATYSLTGDKDGLFPLIDFDCDGFICDEITIIPLKNSQLCLKYFENIKSQYYNKLNLFQVFGTFYMLLDEVFSKPTTSHNLLLSATEYIEKNLSCHALTNGDIAQHLKISEVYLRKLFIKDMGISPKQYIIEHRFQKAKSLLTDSVLPITAISEKCGFSSVYHFCRAFKQKAGQTPTEYAIKNRIYKI